MEHMFTSRSRKQERHCNVLKRDPILGNLPYFPLIAFKKLLHLEWLFIQRKKKDDVKDVGMLTIEGKQQK